tara:strand:+ start:715 stop:2916 length:2202 start_codon:yes stop_codon:yes gene_type:complete
MAKEMEEVVVRARRPGFSSNAPRGGGGGGGISGSGFNTSNYFGGDPSFLSSEALLEDFDPTPDFSDRRRLRDRIADRVNQARENYPIATKAIELAAGSTALGQAVGGINLAKKVVNKMQDKEKKAMGGMMYNKGSLVGNQSLLDKNDDGKISGEDFKMLREKKIFGGLLRLSSVGARKAGKLLLDDATKDVKKISKDLPKDQSFKDATGIGSSKEDILSQQAAAMARPVGSFRDVSQVRENKYHIETLEDFFSGEPKLEKAIKQLRKQIYSKVEDKDIADDIYATKLLELESKYSKQYKRLTNDAAREVLEKQEREFQDSSLMIPPEMLREKKVIGGILNVTRVGSKALARSLLSDATKEVRDTVKKLPSVNKQNEIKNKYEVDKGDIDRAFDIKESINEERQLLEMDIDTLENFFSGETQLDKAIKQLKKKIYRKIKNKDVANEVYASKLEELQQSILSNPSYKKMIKEEQGKIKGYLDDNPELTMKTVLDDAEMDFLDPESDLLGGMSSSRKAKREVAKKERQRERERNMEPIIPFNKGGRVEYQEGSLMMPPEMESKMPLDTYPNIPPEEMAEAEASQLPDAEMEDQYMNFVLDQSLDDDEQSYLMNALETDPKLSQIFDKVITTASEFTGAGEVEGPGTGVSDSIPARLSDGEFVFTKKATDQIGADNLQMMMDDAERAFDGGMMREPKRMGSMIMKDEDPDLMEAMSNEDINRQMLMSNRAPSLLGTN